MHLAVDAQRFGQMRDFHRPGDTHVVFGIRTQEVRAAGQNEIGLRLDPTDMFGL